MLIAHVASLALHSTFVVTERNALLNLRCSLLLWGIRVICCVIRAGECRWVVPGCVYCTSFLRILSATVRHTSSKTAELLSPHAKEGMVMRPPSSLAAPNIVLRSQSLDVVGYKTAEFCSQHA